MNDPSKRLENSTPSVEASTLIPVLNPVYTISEIPDSTIDPKQRDEAPKVIVGADPLYDKELRVKLDKNIPTGAVFALGDIDLPETLKYFTPADEVDAKKAIQLRERSGYNVDPGDIVVLRSLSPAKAKKGGYAISYDKYSRIIQETPELPINRILQKAVIKI